MQSSISCVIWWVPTLFLYEFVGIFSLVFQSIIVYSSDSVFWIIKSTEPANFNSVLYIIFSLKTLCLLKYTCLLSQDIPCLALGSVGSSFLIK